MKTIKYLALVLLLSGCSSIPLGSIAKLAALDKNELTNIPPHEVRARITLNEPAELSAKNLRLVLKFEYLGHKEKEYQFILDLMNARTLTESNWFSGSVKRHQYEFKISENSVDDFRDYQKEFARYGKPEKYFWTVYYYLKKQPMAGENLNLDLELKFAADEAYIYLLKSAEVDVE